MDPVSLILGAASAAGAILGGQRKMIDPKWLEQHFGAGAVSEEALKLFNQILNSPYGQGVLSSASEQAQQFQRNVNRGAAESGLAGPEGSSGTGVFATSAAQGATDAFQRDARSQFYQMALPAAQQMVQDRMQAYLADRSAGGVQTPGARMWQGIGQAAGTIGAMLPEKKNEISGAGAAPSATGAFTPNAGGTMPFYEGGVMRNALSSTQPVLPQTVLRRASRFPSMSGLVTSGGR